MAIKVNGTTVIDDSRNLSNVGGLKTVNGTNMVGSGNIAFKTVNGSSVVGSGNISAGASTTYGAVGTYVFGYRRNTGIVNGNTYSGSQIEPGGLMSLSGSTTDDDLWSGSYFSKGGSSLSGTWRAMGRMNYDSGATQQRWTLFVRIS
jgi:hypothetical protein